MKIEDYEMIVLVKNHEFERIGSYRFECKYCHIIRFRKDLELAYSNQVTIPPCISDEEKIIKNIIE